MTPRTAYDPGPEIASCGTVNLGTPNIERSLRFFRDVLGMEVVEAYGDAAYLRGFQELAHHSLVLTDQAESVVNAMSFQVKRPEDLALFAERFRAEGVEVVEVPAGAERGRGEAIRFLVPHGGHAFELYYDMTKPAAPEVMRSRLPSNSSKRRGLGVRRLDHFNVQTSPETVAAAERWVCDALGFKRRECVVRNGSTLQSSWMSVTPQVHDLAIGTNAAGKAAQMHHVAFNIGEFSDLLVAADTIRDLDVVWGAGPGKHGIAQSGYLYVFDPGSEHRIELYSGGYLIFDPAWQPIVWTNETMNDAMHWIGHQIDFTPGGPGRRTTGFAGLDWRAARG